ncbi:MAG TPA: energy transducer TonB [Longimicrobium sp.]|nr:energy transducer TonB [Longimicrobium sp.]
MKRIRTRTMPVLAAIAAVLAESPALAQKPGNDLGAKRPTVQEHPDFVGRGMVADRPSPKDGTYELSAVDEQPVLLNRAVAARAMAHGYPCELRSQGITGMVVLRFVIRPDGTTDPLSVGVETATNAAFVEPASDVVRQMRFEPAKVGGVPVRVWVTLPITFALEEPRRPPKG